MPKIEVSTTDARNGIDFLSASLTNLKDAQDYAKKVSFEDKYDWNNVKTNLSNFETNTSKYIDSLNSIMDDIDKHNDAYLEAINSINVDSVHKCQLVVK